MAALAGGLGSAQVRASWRRAALAVGNAVALGISLFALAWLSIELTRQSGRVAAIWPVNAAAVVWLLRAKIGHWPGLLLGGLLGVLTADLAWGNPLATALELSLCNSLEIAACAAVLRRFGAPRLDLQRCGHLGLFAAVCVVGPTLFALPNLHVILANAHTAPVRAVVTWILADSLGMLVLIPPLLLLRSASMARAISSRRIANVAGLLLLAGVVAGVFLQSRPPLLFLVSPALVLVTFQMEITGAALGVLLTAAIAGSLASMGYGPQVVVGGDLTEQMVAVQVFLLVCATTTLPIGATLAERRRVKASLGASEARYRLLADNTTDIIILMNDQGVVSYASPSVSRYGYEPQDIIGHNTLEFVHPDDVAVAAEIRGGLFSGGQVDLSVRREYRTRTKAGDYVWLEGNPTILRDAAGRPTQVVTSYRDVTLRHQLEDDLVAAKSLAEAAAEAKSEFLANMSHEIRTPLTGVIGFAELLDAMPGLPAEAELCVRRIAVASQSLLAVVNDVLDFSKLEAGQVELSPHAFDPARLARDAVEIVAGQAREKGLALDLSLDPALPAFVLADSGRLRQVLLNLVGNAVKFTEAGSVRVTVSHETAPTPRLVVAVSDTGPGIPADRRDRLFQRFSQVDGSIGRQFGGTGLGLAICHELTRLMGGGISVDSKVGHGSTFRFEIAAPPAEAPAVRAIAEPLEIADGREANILVVDDVAVNRELVRAMLTPLGFKIAEAASGLEALELCAGADFDLILMDLQMPVMDGLTTTRAVRALGPQFQAVPILAISANVLDKHLAACEAAGMDDHIAKPIRAAELVTKVCQWLQSGRASPQAAVDAA